MADSTIGKYDIKIKKYELRNKFFSIGAKVVAFYAHQDESFITVCSYVTRNSSSEIVLSNFRNNDQIKITLQFEIKSMVLTENGQILASIHNKSDNSSSLVILF